MADRVELSLILNLAQAESALNQFATRAQEQAQKLQRLASTQPQAAAAVRTGLATESGQLRAMLTQAGPAGSGVISQAEVDRLQAARRAAVVPGIHYGDADAAARAAVRQKESGRTGARPYTGDVTAERSFGAAESRAANQAAVRLAAQLAQRSGAEGEAAATAKDLAVVNRQLLTRLRRLNAQLAGEPVAVAPGASPAELRQAIATAQGRLRAEGRPAGTDQRTARAVTQRTEAETEAAASARNLSTVTRQLTRRLERYNAQLAEGQVSVGAGASPAELNQAVATAQVRLRQQNAAFRASAAGGGGEGEEGGGGLFGGFGGRAFRHLQYAISGAAIYGVAGGIALMLHDAAELEKQLALVRAQFEAVDKVGEFPRMRAAILDIARSSGEAAKDVAFVAFQMEGAFENTTTAIEQTTAAIQLARVTGLSVAELVDSLTAVSKTYGVGIGEIGDKALGLQSRLGVLAKQTLSAVGDLAPVAKEVGLSMQQVETLIAVGQQVTARSGSAVAEAFGRILPAMQAHRFEIAAIYQTVPGLEKAYRQVSEAIGQGNMGAVLDRLIRDWDKLGKTQQEQIITALGGRREAQTLIAVLQNQGKYVKEMDSNFNDAGRTSRYFADLQTSLSQRMAELRQRFTELGLAILQSGLGDALKDLVTVGSAVFDVLSRVARAFATVNDATGGFVGRLAVITVGIATVNKLLGATLAQRGLAGLTGLFSGFGVARGAGQAAAQLAAAPAGGPAGAGLLGRGAAYLGGFGGALGISATTFGIGAAVAAGFTYKSMIDDAKKKNNERFQRFLDEQAYSDKALKGIRDDTTHFWTRFNTAITGAESAQTTAGRALRVRASQGLQQQFQDVASVFTEGGAPGALTQHQLVDILKKAGLGLGAVYGLHGGKVTPLGAANAPVDPKIIDDVIKRAKGGDAQAIAVEQALNNYQQSTFERARLYNEAIKRTTKRRSFAQAQQYIGAKGLKEGEEPQAITDIKAFTEQFQAGDISFGQYVVSLRRVYQVFRDAKSTKAPEATALLKQINQAYAAQAKAGYDLANQLAGIQGSRDVNAQSIQRAIHLLQDPKFTDPKLRLQVAQDIVRFSQGLADERAKTAKTAEDAINILEHGVQIPEAARVVILEEQLRNLDPVISTYIATWAHGNQRLIDQMAHQLAIALVGGEAGLRAIIADLKKRIAELEKIAARQGVGGGIGAALKAMYDQLQFYEGILNQLPASTVGVPQTAGGGDEGKEKARQAKQQLAQAKQAVERARIEAARSGAQGDALAVAKIEQQLAQQQIDSANAAIASAKLIQDPIERETAILNAEAQQISALAAKAQSDRGVEDALHNINQSKFDLLKALADAAQDVVRSAQLDVGKAADQLTYDLQHHAGEDVLNRDRANLATAQANAGRVTRQNEESIIDFNLQARRITTSAAIAQLTAILSTLDQSTQEYRELYLKILGLRDQLGQDYQLNLPSTLGLPTLYEARRLSQTPGGQTNYDNRQITINVTVNNPIDQRDLINNITNAVGAAPRYGTRPSLYPRG